MPQHGDLSPSVVKEEGTNCSRVFGITERPHRLPQEIGVGMFCEDC